MLRLMVAAFSFGCACLLCVPLPRLLNFLECFLFLQLLTGTVSSLEDHGYLVDIGVAGARAFLPLQKAQEYIRQNKGEGRKRGQCVIVRWCIWRLYINATLVSKMTDW